jgi:hypothetical protein
MASSGFLVYWVELHHRDGSLEKFFGEVLIVNRISHYLPFLFISAINHIVPSLI